MKVNRHNNTLSSKVNVKFGMKQVNACIYDRIRFNTNLLKGGGTFYLSLPLTTENSVMI
jgi:hypothetical protein